MGKELTSFAGQVHDWLVKIGFSTFSIDGLTQGQISNTCRFVFKTDPKLDQELPVPKEFFENPTVSIVARLACQLHQEDKRKATSDPYFKHTLKTAYLCVQMVNPSEAGGQTDYWEIREAVAFLHDVIEMKRKNGLPYKEEQLICDLVALEIPNDTAQKIAYLVNKLTPEPKEEDLSLEQRRIIKREDFLRTMTEKCRDWEGTPEEQDILARMLRTVKAADILANLEETVTNLLKGVDHPKFTGENLIYLVGVFQDRIEYLDENQNLIPETFILPLKSYLSQLEAISGPISE